MLNELKPGIWVLLIKDTTPELSVAVGSLHMTDVLVLPPATVAVTSSVQVTTGGIWSSKKNDEVWLICMMLRIENGKHEVPLYWSSLPGLKIGCSSIKIRQWEVSRDWTWALNQLNRFHGIGKICDGHNQILALFNILKINVQFIWGKGDCVCIWFKRGYTDKFHLNCYRKEK